MKCPKCHSDNPDTARSCGVCASPLPSQDPPGPPSDSLTKTARMPPGPVAPGTVVAGKYRIVEEIGRGGMGIVFRAHDASLDRDVALKVLPAASFDNPAARAQLLREARTASQLNHPAICTIYEVGEAEGLAFIAMEFIEGQTLSAKSEAKALPEDEVLEYGEQVANALSHAHERGIIHRDLKCANVILSPQGRAKVLDFGLAKRLNSEDESGVRTLTRASLTVPGRLTGTLAYMAPEQLRGRPADARSDIWALGVMLYEMAAGHRPFHGKTGFELSSAILNETPTLPATVPPGLKGVIERCLAKDPDRRYQTAEDVGAALKTIRSGRSVPWAGWRYTLWRRRWPILAASAVMVAAAVVLGWNVAGLRSRLLGGGPALRFRSLAVLPLRNLSGDTEQDYFADGMTEELINNLAKISALDKVVSRTSMMQYRGTTKPLPVIAKELDVQAVVEGSVLREGDRVRVTAQLIQASNDKPLWAESYERDLRSVMALQGEIASAIAGKISAVLTPTDRARLSGSRPVNPEAYEAYLKGKFYINKMTEEGYEKGLSYLQQAVEKDPSNPQSYAALALAYSIIGHERDPGAYEHARAAMKKAEELGGEPMAEMYVAWGMTKLYSEWDYAGAEKDLRRAMELNPSLGEAHRDYSWYLNLVGRREEALVKMKQAQEVDPLNPLFYADRGWQFWWMGQYDSAIEEARKSLELDANFNEGLCVLGYVYADKGMYPEAIAVHRKLAEVDPSWRWCLVTTLIRAGRKDEAKATLAKFLTEKPEPVAGWDAWFLIDIYAALGDREEALRWLEAAYKERNSLLPWIGDNKFYEPLHGDPRYEDIVKRMSVPKEKAT
jgi:serine/threonine protein kinase/Tfp pilus assembly protein PilF